MSPSDDNPTLRVVVKVTRGSHPELYSALNVVARQGRAERLRHMCTAFLLGQYGSRPGAVAPDGNQAEDETEFRLVVKINLGAHPELYQALLSVSPRGRAERMRHMGTVFVSGLVGGAAPPSHLPSAGVPPSANAPLPNDPYQASPPEQVREEDAVSSDDLMASFAHSV